MLNSFVECAEVVFFFMVNNNLELIFIERPVIDLPSLFSGGQDSGCCRIRIHRCIQKRRDVKEDFPIKRF